MQNLIHSILNKLPRLEVATKEVPDQYKDQFASEGDPVLAYNKWMAKEMFLDPYNIPSIIKEEMDELLRQSQEAVNMADDVQKTNRQQQEVINDTFNSVNSMIGDIEETVKGVRVIADNAENCVAAKDKVVDVMGSLSAISEENAAACEETGASMEELSATVTTLAGSARSMHDVSNNLNDEVGFFKI